MKAYILQTFGDEFFNTEHFAAYDGFDKRMFDIEFFTPDKILNIEVNEYTPVIAGIDLLLQIFRVHNVTPKNIEIPKGLEKHLKRKTDVITLGEAIKKFNQGEKFFLKPAEDHKLFTGFVLDSSDKLINFSGLDQSKKVIISEIKNIISEYRVFIYKGVIVGMKHYKGDFMVFPSVEFIENVLNDIEEEMPIAYSLDFGIFDNNETFFIEANDSYALGAYGLNTVLYSKMIEDRWKEIFKGNKC